jgi:hypothetical protein
MSKEQVAGCELRVSGYPEQDRAKIAAQARGQRLKLLQRWFWKAFFLGQYITSPGASDYGSFEKYLEGIDALMSAHLPAFRASGAGSEITDEVRANLRQKYNRHGSAQALREWVYRVNSERIRLFPNDVGQAAYMEACFGQPGLDAVMNNRITEQAIEFICSRQQFSLLESLVVYAAILILDSEDGEAFKTAGCQQSAQGLAGLILKFICVVDWVSAFQRLESEAQQRKVSA